MQPVNNKRILPNEYYTSHAKLEEKKTKPNESNQNSQSTINQCALQTFNSYSDSSDDDYSSEIDISEMEVCELKNVNNLPEIWHCAKNKDWQGVFRLLYNCSTTDFEACPQLGPDKNKTLLILAILSAKWEIVEKIAGADGFYYYNYNYKGEKALELPEFNNLIEYVVITKKWNVYDAIVRDPYWNSDRDTLLPQIDQKLFDFFSNEAIHDQGRGVLCLVQYLRRYPFPISNDQFNDIILRLFEEGWDPSGGDDVRDSLLNKFFSVYTDHRLQPNESNTKKLLKLSTESYFTPNEYFQKRISQLENQPVSFLKFMVKFIEAKKTTDIAYFYKYTFNKGLNFNYDEVSNDGPWIPKDPDFSIEPMTCHVGMAEKDFNEKRIFEENKFFLGALKNNPWIHETSFKGNKIAHDHIVWLINYFLPLGTEIIERLSYDFSNNNNNPFHAFNNNQPFHAFNNNQPFYEGPPDGWNSNSQYRSWKEINSWFTALESLFKLKDLSFSLKQFHHICNQFSIDLKNVNAKFKHVEENKLLHLSSESLNEIEKIKKTVQSCTKLLIQIGFKIPNFFENKGLFTDSIFQPIFETFERLAELKHLHVTLPFETLLEIAHSLCADECPILNEITRPIFIEGFIEGFNTYLSCKNKELNHHPISNIVSLAFGEFRLQNGLSEYPFTEGQIFYARYMIEKCLNEYIAQHPQVQLTQYYRKRIVKEIGKNQNASEATLNESLIKQAIVTAMKM